MKDPRMDEFRAWQKAANGLLNKIALAPEREGVEDFVRTVTGEGVTVALGHSNATFDEAKKPLMLEQVFGFMLIMVCVV